MIYHTVKSFIESANPSDNIIIETDNDKIHIHRNKLEFSFNATDNTMIIESKLNYPSTRYLLDVSAINQIKIKPLRTIPKVKQVESVGVIL